MLSNSVHLPAASAPSGNSPYIRRGEDARMAGSVPVWGSSPRLATVSAPSFAESLVAHTKAPATHEKMPTSAAAFAATEHKMSLSPTISDSMLGETVATPEMSEAFSFGDLIDMLNPLHHIPVVNIAYRAITGDEIRGISKVVGGALFAGPIGAAAGLADVAIKSGTGADVAGHAASAFGVGPKPINAGLAGTTIAVASLGLHNQFVSHRLND